MPRLRERRLDVLSAALLPVIVSPKVTVDDAVSTRIADRKIGGSFLRIVGVSTAICVPAALGGMAANTGTRGMKDSAAMRGRRLCVTGSVVQIMRDQSAPFPLLAVGNTAGVVEHVTARYCGITPGIEIYTTQAGGQMTAVEICKTRSSGTEAAWVGKLLAGQMEKVGP